MKNSKILIVEDEQIIAENLRFILNDYGYNCVDVAMDVLETENLFKETEYDLVLMDINLGDVSIIDGVDLIKLLSKKYNFAHLYVTANADKKTVKKAKDTNPDGYIVKPFLNSSIYANVEIALNTLNEKVFYILTNKGRKKQISISKITNIIADGAYANIYTLNDDKFIVRKSLIEISMMYPSIFIRIHKSILIHKNHIQGYTSKFVKINNRDLTIGRTYKSHFLEQIKKISFS